MSMGEQITIGLIIGVTLAVAFIYTCVIISSNSGPSASKLGSPFMRSRKRKRK